MPINCLCPHTSSSFPPTVSCPTFYYPAYPTLLHHRLPLCPLFLSPTAPPAPPASSSLTSHNPPLLHPSTLPHANSYPLLHTLCLLPGLLCVPQSHGPERVGLSNTWGEVSAAEKAASQRRGEQGQGSREEHPWPVVSCLR